MIATLADDQARERIRTDLTSTLFVDAGAGSGKTASLVGRVVALVLAGNVPLRQIAAVTFTEKAAAELRDRLREEFEQARTAQPEDAARIATIDEALDDLDAAAIGTLHSFAQRILGEHPIEAGLPPLIEVTDEVASQVAFEHRWSALRSALLEEPELRDPCCWHSSPASSSCSFEPSRNVSTRSGTDFKGRCSIRERRWRWRSR